MSVKRKTVLAFVIVNFLLLTGFAVMLFVSGITNEYAASAESGVHFNPRPLLFMLAGVVAILALVAGFAGIFTYKGKKWAANALIIVGAVSLLGIFGAAAGIIELVTPRNRISQS